MAVSDPSLGVAVMDSQRGHNVVTTVTNYDGHASDYINFCLIRGLVPFPADGLQLSGWILRLMCTVKPSSLKTYLAAVRSAQLDRNIPWTLTGDESVRRTLRHVRRKFPSVTKGLKIPISLKVLRVILCLLPGWPVMDVMSHEHRMFAAASVLAVMAFLRGGEFLASKGSARAYLKFVDVTLKRVRSMEAVVVAIPQPKATPWLDRVLVPCFVTAADDFCPKRLWEGYSSRSPCAVGPDLPAFHAADGSPLQRDWMVSLTLSLMQRAGIVLTDSQGNSTTVKSASWRAGGVDSAVEAGLSEPLIKELGRWRSNAWTHYLLYSTFDLCAASARMAKAAQVVASTPLPMCVRVVRESGPGPITVAEDAQIASAAAEACSVDLVASRPRTDPRLRKAPRRTKRG